MSFSLHLSPSIKSPQVPGVKLRPAEKGSFSRSVEESCWAEDTQVGSDDTTVLDLCPRPFKGVVICATGVPDKVRYALVWV